MISGRLTQRREFYFSLRPDDEQTIKTFTERSIINFYWEKFYFDSILIEIPSQKKFELSGKRCFLVVPPSGGLKSPRSVREGIPSVYDKNLRKFLSLNMID